MPAKTASETAELRARLRSVEERMNRELRARGFDPLQLENIPLPTTLALLSVEQENLRKELQDMEGLAQSREPGMNEIERIKDQFRRAFEGGAWHGPAVLELLEGIDATQAAAHPVPNAHSIWELTLHIAAWKNAIRRRLEGDRAYLSDEEDWPAITNTDEANWQAAKQELIDVHRELLEKISQLDESKLDQPIVEGLMSVYGSLHGVVQHDLYHAGQIALLKKAIQGSA